MRPRPKKHRALLAAIMAGGALLAPQMTAAGAAPPDRSYVPAALEAAIPQAVRIVSGRLAPDPGGAAGRYRLAVEAYLKGRGPDEIFIVSRYPDPDLSAYLGLPAVYFLSFAPRAATDHFTIQRYAVLSENDLRLLAFPLEDGALAGAPMMSGQTATLKALAAAIAQRR